MADTAQPPGDAVKKPLEALLFAQVLRPLSAALGPLGDVVAGEVAAKIAETRDA